MGFYSFAEKSRGADPKDPLPSWAPAKLLSYVAEHHHATHHILKLHSHIIQLVKKRNFQLYATPRNCTNEDMKKLTIKRLRKQLRYELKTVDISCTKGAGKFPNAKLYYIKLRSTSA